MKRLFESPDHIVINGKKIMAKDRVHKQRPIIIFRSGHVWIGSIGQTHEDLIEGEDDAPEIYNALTGRVWVDLKIISFWHNPMRMLGEDYIYYLDILKEELARYKIDMTKLRFDVYNTWEPVNKKYADPKLMVKYYDDSVGNYSTPLDTYDEYIARLKKYAGLALTPSVPENSPKKREIRTSGSPKTSWDSDNNIRHRQSKRTSESYR